jgi:signal transduction histidine kinase
MRMKIQLASEESELQKLCHDIFSEFSAQEWELQVGYEETEDADLYIWDYTPGMTFPAFAGSLPSQHIFLAQRKDVAAFRQTAPFPEATILLKPVTRAALIAFASQAVSAHNHRVSEPPSVREERDEILQCLIEANLKLQEYDQDRTNFLARGIHDFRAPLTAINGYCGLLLSTALGPMNAEQREVLQRMQRSTKRLSRMASAMFQLSVGRQRKQPLDLRKNDLPESFSQALHEINPMAEGKHLSITVSLEPEPGPLYFEDGQMEQLLVNLLDNACKFTPKCGEIEINGYPYFWERRTMSSTASPRPERRRTEATDPNSYRVDIRNSGFAIPQHLLRTIFEEYMSYGGGQDRSGGGLGLAICRMIATQHNGAIWAENTESGPMFSFVLPLYPQAPKHSLENEHIESQEFAEVF